MTCDQGHAKSWVSFMALVIVWFSGSLFSFFFFLDNIEKGTHTLQGFEDFGIKSETAIASKKCFESVFKNHNQLCEYGSLFSNTA